MKTKLLWIGIPSVLIITVAGFVFFDAKNLELKQNNTVIEKSEQVIPLYHGTIDEDKDWTYLSIEDCYDESGVLNEKPNIDDNGNIINCYNENREKDGKWVTYTESRFGKEYKHEINYKKGKENGKSIHYDENGKISLTEYNKNGERDGEIIFYDNGKIREKGNYVNGEPEGEHIEYFDGEWMSKTIYESGEIIDIQDNHEVIEKFMKYYENEKLILENIWNKFSAGGVINNDEFEDLVISIYSDYGIYYDEIINDDEEIREFHEDMYKRNYEDKSWELLALYSMMNCSEDPSNPDTYLFNLDNPKLAQETYFKNCPKGCRYSDEEDVDFVCE